MPAKKSDSAISLEVVLPTTVAEADLHSLEEPLRSAVQFLRAAQEAIANTCVEPESLRLAIPIVIQLLQQAKEELEQFGE